MKQLNAINSKLQLWVTTTMQEQCNSPDLIDLLPLNGDAGFRKYYRFNINHQFFLAVDSPPRTEKNNEFIAVQYILKNINVAVPNIIKYDAEQGFFIIEDFGDETLLPLLQEQLNLGASGVAVISKLYQSSVASLLKLQQYNGSNYAIDSHKLLKNFNYTLPKYDQKLLNFEMELFRDWFVDKYLGLKLSLEQHDLLNNIFALLIVNAEAQPEVLVHRDYHSRNLIKLNNDAIGVIDFQDAVLGPVTYDLVSLFRDCYIAWPIEIIKQWTQDYFVQAKSLKIIDENLDFKQFWLWFLQMSLQRNFKTIGIFARLYLRDNKPGYLSDIPRTFNYALEVTQILAQEQLIQSAAFANLNLLLKETFLPALVMRRQNSDITEVITTIL